MAARTNKITHDDKWPFYVYALTSDGAIRYYGKGSGKRLSVQKNIRKCNGHEVARFKKEIHAYEFEKEMIELYKPEWNRCSGGGGSKSSKIRYVQPAWLRKQNSEMNELGSRRYVARLILSKDLSVVFHPSKVEEIRKNMLEVWHGPRC